jgi:hypothetical protein
MNNLRLLFHNETAARAIATSSETLIRASGTVFGDVINCIFGYSEPQSDAPRPARIM